MRSRITKALCSLMLSISVFFAGCAPLLHYSGMDLDRFKTREQVHKSMGRPDHFGYLLEGEGEFEEFRTHAKISDPAQAGRDLLLDLATFGLFDPFLLPQAILVATIPPLIGCTVRFEYDQNGKIIRYSSK